MLTDARVRSAKPRQKAYKIADANRLFLMVTPSGGKLWRWNYEYDGKHRPMSENAIGYLRGRAGYHGHHVPHGFRAAFSTIMNEWAERHGKPHDRKVIDVMLAHVPKDKIEGAYNRAAYMPRRRELATIWANMLSEGLPDPVALVDRPVKEVGLRSRRRLLSPVEPDFRFPVERRAAR